MNWSMPPEALNLLLVALQDAQLALRAVLHAVGLAPDIHGQPAWPFAQRVAGEMLSFDAGHARHVAMSVVCLVLVSVLMLLSTLWRRARKALWVVAVVVLLATPWPAVHLLLSPAVPTSLHQSPSGFTAAGIVRGRAVYQQHCVNCHGVDGRGEGPDAAKLPMWPPTLNGSLLWKRLDGELFWRVRHGMRARDGTATMPGFADHQLSDTQVWEVLDFLQAQASGQMLKESGTWANPVRMPDTAVLCRNGRSHTARSLMGQRLRVAVATRDAPDPADDPRLVTVLVRPLQTPTALSDPECQADMAALSESLSLILGVDTATLPGHQLIVDRGGWLRARSQPGQSAWSEDDLVCKSTAATSTPAQNTRGGDGLEQLIRRMDAEPVRLLRGGFPH